MGSGPGFQIFIQFNGIFYYEYYFEKFSVLGGKKLIIWGCIIVIA